MHSHTQLTTLPSQSYQEELFGFCIRHTCPSSNCRALPLWCIFFLFLAMRSPSSIDCSVFLFSVNACGRLIDATEGTGATYSSLCLTNNTYSPNVFSHFSCDYDKTPDPTNRREKRLAHRSGEFQLQHIPMGKAWWPEFMSPYARKQARQASKT